MSKYSRELKKKKLADQAVKSKLNPKKMTREGFIEYIEKNVNFIGVLRTTDGGVFLNFSGVDETELKAHKLGDGPEYTKPGEIDEYILKAAESLKHFGAKVPTVSFTQFCKI